MTLPVIISLISASMFVISVIIGVIQLNLVKKQRAREAELLLVRSFQTRDFMKALNLVLNLEDGLSRKEILDVAGIDKEFIFFWLGTWESLGIMVYRKEISMSAMDDYFSGPIVISWKKLEKYVMEEREALQRDTMHEWFQWLAERMLERESNIPVKPAHLAYKNWKE